MWSDNYQGYEQARSKMKNSRPAIIWPHGYSSFEDWQEKVFILRPSTKQDVSIQDLKVIFCNGIQPEELVGFIETRK